MLFYLRELSYLATENLPMAMTPSRSPRADVIERLTAYWHQRAAGRTFPARADIDPLDFPYALGRVSLVEVHPGADGYRYRYRLVSTELTERLGFEMTGKFADEIP